MFVKKESTEIDCFDLNHGFIQIYAYHRWASWVRVSFAGVKGAGGFVYGYSYTSGSPLCRNDML